MSVVRGPWAAVASSWYFVLGALYFERLVIKGDLGAGSNLDYTSKYKAQRTTDHRPAMEINLMVTLDLREQAALQAALVTHGAPDCLVTLALTGACRISTLNEVRKLHDWLARARTTGEADFASLHAIERALVQFGL